MPVYQITFQRMPIAVRVLRLRNADMRSQVNLAITEFNMPVAGPQLGSSAGLRSLQQSCIRVTIEVDSSPSKMIRHR